MITFRREQNKNNTKPVNSKYLYAQRELTKAAYF